MDEGGGLRSNGISKSFKLLSLVPDMISATFDNSNDLIQNIAQAKEMAKEVIQIASARAESFYNELFQLHCGGSRAT